MLLVTTQTARRVTQLGLVFAGLGALSLIWSGALLLSRSPNVRRRGWLTIAAGLLLGIGFAVQILGIHLTGGALKR